MILLPGVIRKEKLHCGTEHSDQQTDPSMQYSAFTHKQQGPAGKRQRAVFTRALTQDRHPFSSKATQKEIYLCTCNRRVFTCL